MSRFRRHFRCARGHLMSTEGHELHECQVWVGPVRKRVRCDAALTELFRRRVQEKA